MDQLNQTLFNFYKRKMKLYALVFLGLMEEPLEYERKEKWTPLEQLLGWVSAHAYLLDIKDIKEEEVREAARDLCNPFIRAIEQKVEDRVYYRLVCLPRNVIFDRMGILQYNFIKEIIELVEKIKAAKEIYKTKIL